MTTTSSSSSSESDGEQRIAPSTVPKVPSLPPTSSSRGGVDNKEKLAGIHDDTFVPTNISRDENHRQELAPDTRSLETAGPPPKIFLSANPNEVRPRPITMIIPSSQSTNTSDHDDGREHGSANLGTNPRTIASAILGRQQKLENVITNEAQNTSAKASNSRPSNIGAFAIAGLLHHDNGEETSRETSPVAAAAEETNGQDRTVYDDNMIHAEIAPDVEEIVQERLQAIQQERDNEIVVAVATHNNNDRDDGENHNDAIGDNNNNKDNNPGFQWTNRNKLFVAISMLCFTILVAGVTGGIVASTSSKEQSSVITTTLSPSTSPAPTITASDLPTVMPTTSRQGMIVPNLFGMDDPWNNTNNTTTSHPEALQWLVENDNWVPPPTASDPQGLWRERYFMVAFFFATRGGDDVWFDRRNWLSPTSSVCEWDGDEGAEFGDDMEILCDPNTGKVQRLTIRQNRLLGTIPSEIKALSMLELIDFSRNSLRGSLPSSIGLLSHMTRIDMHGNQLTGSLPSNLGNLVNLQALVLHQTALTGQLPSEVGKCSALQSISLYENNVRGTLPKEISQWTNLLYFDLHDNILSGPLPEIANWTQVQLLSLSSNRLTGTLPTVLGSLTNLRDLVLNDNRFGGPVPSELGLLTRLVSLNLRSNELSGELPTELLRLSSTYIFDVSYNRLSGTVPPFPSNSSQILCLDGNRFSDMGNRNDRCGGYY